MSNYRDLGQSIEDFVEKEAPADPRVVTMLGSAGLTEVDMQLFAPSTDATILLLCTGAS